VGVEAELEVFGVVEMLDYFLGELNTALLVDSQNNHFLIS